jgi:hypothetical protein
MLEQNDRLTNEFGNAWFIATGRPVAKYWSTANKARLIQRLGEYEDTGYTPEEIRQMIQMVKEMDRAVDELESCLGEMKT